MIIAFGTRVCGVGTLTSEDWAHGAGEARRAVRCHPSSCLRNLAMLVGEGTCLKRIKREHSETSVADAHRHGERASQIVWVPRIRFDIEARVGIQSGLGLAATHPLTRLPSGMGASPLMRMAPPW